MKRVEMGINKASDKDGKETKGLEGAMVPPWHPLRGPLQDLYIHKFLFLHAMPLFFSH